MSTLFQDAICFFTTSHSTALIEHVLLLLRAVKGFLHGGLRGTAAVGQNEDLFGGLGRRPSKLGPTGSVRASFMHVAGHTYSESRDMNTNIILSVSTQRKTSLLASHSVVLWICF